MLKICLVFWKSEPQYAYKRYAYKKHVCFYSLDILYSNWNLRFFIFRAFNFNAFDYRASEKSYKSRPLIFAQSKISFNSVTK